MGTWANEIGSHREPIYKSSAIRLLHDKTPSEEGNYWGRMLLGRYSVLGDDPCQQVFKQSRRRIVGAKYKAIQ